MSAAGPVWIDNTPNKLRNQQTGKNKKQLQMWNHRGFKMLHNNTWCKNTPHKNMLGKLNSGNVQAKAFYKAWQHHGQRTQEPKRDSPE